MNKKKNTSDKRYAHYRSLTFRTAKRLRLRSKFEAVEFVNSRGYVFFWPIKGIDLPSLWCAVAGDRPVPNNHDDPGHITWQWKDDLLGKKKWYYAKILRGKSTIISYQMVPFFFAISQTIHDGIDEINYLYRQGKLTVEEKQIFTMISVDGPIDTITLRDRFQFKSSASPSRFDRALVSLQRSFRIVPTGISPNGRWNYSYLYQTVQDEYPELIDRSKDITKSEALQKILLTYFLSIGIGTEKMIKKVFQWPDSVIKQTISILIKSKEIERMAQGDQTAPVYLISKLL
jgi:hypothetical protein